MAVRTVLAIARADRKRVNFADRTLMGLEIRMNIVLAAMDERIVVELKHILFGSFLV